MSKLITLWYLAVYLGLPLASGETPDQRPLRVSLMQLIATPSQCDGKLVMVYGFLDMTREGDLLFLHREDCDNVLAENAIWLRRTEEIGKHRATLNRKYVSVVGVFKIGFTEHLGSPPNGIPDVKSVVVWSDPDHPLLEKLNGMTGVSPDH